MEFIVRRKTVKLLAAGRKILEILRVSEIEG